jgi:hypothetical protein
MQTACDIGRRNYNAIGLTRMIGISLEKMMDFPITLPTGFGSSGVILTWEGGNGCHGNKVKLRSMGLREDLR